MNPVYFVIGGLFLILGVASAIPPRQQKQAQEVTQPKKKKRKKRKAVEQEQTVTEPVKQVQSEGKLNGAESQSTNTDEVPSEPKPGGNKETSTEETTE